MNDKLDTWWKNPIVICFKDLPLLSLASVVQFFTFASSYFLFPNLFRHTVGLLGRVISLYLHRTIQHRKTRTNIHALTGIRTAIQCTNYQGPRLRPRGQWIGILKIYPDKLLAELRGTTKYLNQDIKWQWPSYDKRYRANISPLLWKAATELKLISCRRLICSDDTLLTLSKTV
jgi:hypothetical protein